MAELTEAVAEAAETVAREAETVAIVSRSISGRDFGLGFFSGGFLSGLITLILSKRHYQLKFEKIANEEIAEMREHYRQRAEYRERLTSSAVVKPSLEKIVEEQGYMPHTPPTVRGAEYVPPEAGGPNTVPEKPSIKAEEIVQQRKTIFDPETGDEWNYEYEQSKRSIDKPYVINRDEYAEQNSEYTGVTLVYYESDDVLCDEHGKPIENTETLVGRENLQFGHGSSDRNVVYIRNEVLSVEMEVLRNPGSYAEEVLLGRDQNRQYGTE